VSVAFRAGLASFHPCDSLVPKDAANTYFYRVLG
jgi:hypothetical protein